jgi:hypothetical protein
VGEPVVDESEIDEQYEIFREFLDTSTPAEAAKKFRRLGVDEAVVRRIVERHEQESIQIRELDEPRSVYRDNRLTWYTGPREGDKNWPALERSLRDKGRDPDDLDEASTKVVSLLDHPKQPTFSTRGLVVGFVQSGKTTNFTAVMAKAADRGYKLFIVLSGIHNALRRQTQIRLENDLIAANPGLWYQVTTPQHDFVPPPNPKAFFANKGQHLLLVVKKNAAVLGKLRKWLTDAGEYLEQCPALIIDDEADQSTVATKTINPLLYDVLSKFPQVGYVGYTATPFANLLIDPSLVKDFYPRDFIVNLPKPAGHQGTEVLFGREPFDWEDAEDVPGGYDMIRTVHEDEIDDLKPRNKKEAAGFEPAVTPSLERAVNWFWLATAARRVRGTGNPHSTMLIHTSVEANVHIAFSPLLRGLRAGMLRRLDRGDEQTVSDLRRLWSTETSKVVAADFGEQPVEFDALFGHLRDVVRGTDVVIDNYRSTDRLDYDSGPVTAIAVGGNTLSRGLTLEGLVCSVFVRAASAYDTLLQMGRWFGYRDGYADLPRIWMTDELKDWFRHLATVEAEMRLDIDRYMTTDETPMTFAVRLRSHPKMLITAKAKMKNAVLAQAAYGGQLVETRYFKVSHDDEQWLKNNAAAAHRLIQRCGQRGNRVEPMPDHQVLFTEVPHDCVIEFLEHYDFHEKSADGDRKRLINYIEKRLRSGALTRWNVGVIGSSTATRPHSFGQGVSVGMVRRGRLGTENDILAPGEPADIKTLTSARDTTIDLALPADFKVTRGNIEKLRKSQRSGTGLILLYPIEPESRTGIVGRRPLDAPADVVMGVALLFPEPDGEDDTVEFEYYSADLVEQDDLGVLEIDDEEVA